MKWSFSLRLICQPEKLIILKGDNMKLLQRTRLRWKQKQIFLEMLFALSSLAANDSATQHTDRERKNIPSPIYFAVYRFFFDRENKAQKVLKYSRPWMSKRQSKFSSTTGGFSINLTTTLQSRLECSILLQTVENKNANKISNLCLFHLTL